MVKVSVVMGVYNGAEYLEKTLNSILSQDGLTFEVIIVNDGSTDQSGKILDTLAKNEPRLQVFHQPNKGLTQALIHGCQKARGDFIARQDCGDVSLPGRLAAQAKMLQSDPDIAFVSTYTDFVSPQGEKLYCNTSEGLRFSFDPILKGVENFQMPSHHGCTMFRRDSYFKAGGYRSEFYFAQDLDLWSRLIEIGDHAVIPKVMYQAQCRVESISGNYAPEQQQLTKLIHQITCARRCGENEQPLLDVASTIRPMNQPAQKHKRIAAGYYFIGSCLAARKNPKSWQYFFKVICNNPLHIKGWFKLVFPIYYLF